MANNHYVSQLILKRFANKTITTFDVEKECLVKDRHKMNKIFSEQDIYSDGIESELAQKIEGPFANLLDNKVLGKEVIELTRDELFQLKRFLLIDSIRTMSPEGFMKIMQGFSNCVARYVKLNLDLSEKAILSIMPSISVWGIPLHEKLMNTMKMYIDCKSIVEMPVHPYVTKETYLWAKVFSSSFLTFWDSSDDEEFLLCDAGMVTEYEPGHTIFEGLDISKLSYLLNKIEEINTNKADNKRLYQYANLLDINQIMYENFNVFHLSATRCIVLAHPFFKLYSDIPMDIFSYDEKGISNAEQVVFDKPDIWPSWIETREAFNVPVCKYMNAPFYSAEDTFTYKPCKLSTFDTLNINLLQLLSVKKLLGFHDIAKVVNSFNCFVALHISDLLLIGNEEPIRDIAKVTQATIKKFGFILNQYDKKAIESKISPFEFLDYYQMNAMKDVRGNKYLLKYLLSREKETRSLVNLDFMGDADERIEILKSDYKKATGEDWKSN